MHDVENAPAEITTIRSQMARSVEFRGSDVADTAANLAGADL